MSSTGIFSPIQSGNKPPLLLISMDQTRGAIPDGLEKGTVLKIAEGLTE